MLHTRDTALWHALVGEAQAMTGYTLDTETEGYLVTTLMRFIGKMNRGEVEHDSGMNFLDEFMETGRIQSGSMQDIADQCLLFAGLFPDYAGQKKLPINHFIDLGRGTYAELAGRHSDTLYACLSRDFVKLVDILQSLREMDDGIQCLDPMQAYDLWERTGSRNAARTLSGQRGAIPVVNHSSTVH